MGRVAVQEGDTDKRTFYLVAARSGVSATSTWCVIKAARPKSRPAGAGLRASYGARRMDLEYIMTTANLTRVC